MTITHKELDLGMSLFLELIQADQSLIGLVAEARAEYFPGGAGFAGDPRSAPAAEIRFLEWLLFERDHHGGLLVDALLPAWREMAEHGVAALEPTFLGTCVGIYEVGDEAGEGLRWLRDIAGLGEYAVEINTAGGLVQNGDVIVGRLFPRGDSTHVLSPGAGCFREKELLAAVYRDLETARRDRSHKALRIRQVDLEAMFWGDALSAPEVDPVQDLRSFLQAGGLSDDETDGLIEILAGRPIPQDTSGPFFISALQDLLDHLAFETEIDLTQAQGKFLACWLHLRRPQAEASAQAPEAEERATADPKEALKAFDADRAAGLDAETAITRLGARLGVQVESVQEEPGSTGGTPVGLISGLIEEYLWDISRSGETPGPKQEACAELLRGELLHVEIIEEITPGRILLLACTSLCESSAITREDRGGAAQFFADFSRWCVEHHGHVGTPEVTGAFETLPGSILRMDAINRNFDHEHISGDWLQIVHVEGALMAKTADGEAHSLSAPQAVAEMLEAGDFARGTATSGAATLTWCYPPELVGAQRVG